MLTGGFGDKDILGCYAKVATGFLLERERCAKLQQAFRWNGNGAQSCNKPSVGTETVRKVATAFPLERKRCAKLQQAFHWNGNNAQSCNRPSVGTNTVRRVATGLTLERIQCAELQQALRWNGYGAQSCNSLPAGGCTGFHGGVFLAVGGVTVFGLRCTVCGFGIHTILHKKGGHRKTGDHPPD
ncbi:hypothetical protein DMA11_15055 [Marinilabiliaceae bacterium JC017]|nr:hypothetical protein DMA11_15055 [Marinilabiliaceae bacterium JC017]